MSIRTTSAPSLKPPEEILADLPVKKPFLPAEGSAFSVYKRSKKKRSELTTSERFNRLRSAQIEQQDRLSLAVSDIFKHVTNVHRVDEDTKDRLSKNLDSEATPTKKLTERLLYNFCFWKAKNDLSFYDENPEKSRFHITRYISKGTYGKVYEAMDLVKEVPVALKVMNDPKSASHEIEFLNRLSGARNFAQFHLAYQAELDWALDGNKLKRKTVYVITTDYIPYPNLREYYKNPANPPITIPYIAAAAYQIIDFFEDCKKRNMIHCDVKPDNLLGQILSKEEARKLPLNPDKTISLEFREVLRRFPVKVIDVGLAQNNETKNTYTQTRFYRSPAPAMGEELTIDDDLFSLGCTLYELLTKMPLFDSTGICKDKEGQTSEEKRKSHNIVHTIFVSFVTHIPPHTINRDWTDSNFLKFLGKDVYYQARKAADDNSKAIESNLRSIESQLETDEQRAVFQCLQKLITYLLNYKKKKSIAEIKSMPFFQYFTRTSRI